MARFLYHFFSSLRRKVSTIILALFWIFGLVLGCCFHLSCGSSTVSMMCGALDGTVSIVSLLSVILFPFLLSALAVFFFKPSLLPIIAFCKAFSLAFVAAGLLSAYGSAGWLAQLLLMFSDICTTPLLWLFWVRSQGSAGTPSAHETCLWLSLVCLICCLDFYFVSPIPAIL